MDPNISPIPTLLPAENYSPASTPPASEKDADENEDIRLDFEHLDDIRDIPLDYLDEALPSSCVPTHPIIAIPEPSPFFPKKKEEMKTENKLTPEQFEKTDIIVDNVHSDKTAKPLMFPGSRGSTTWSVGYFSELSCGRGDLWRERSIWHRPDTFDAEQMNAMKKEAKKINETRGHCCGVLFWGW